MGRSSKGSLALTPTTGSGNRATNACAFVATLSLMDEQLG